MDENTPSSIPLEQGSPVLKSSEAGVRELLLRLLGSPTDEQLLVGRLPESLPVELPLPEGSRLVGSRIESPEQIIRIVLDTDLSPEAVFSFLRDRFQRAGWYELEQFHNGGGFMGGSNPGTHSLFCRSPGGPQLQLWARAATDAPTHVSLILDARPSSLCARLRGQRGSRQLLPTLTPPPAAQQH